MDLLIPHSWLKDYLKTSATPEKIAECLSLCGPSVEKVTKVGKDHVYSIEVTTNRPDSAGVYGIAREAAAILPRFRLQATLKELKPLTISKNSSNQFPLQIECEISEVRRVMAAVINNVRAKNSPDWLKKRLELSGLRSLNLLIDITNYVMLETGHPTHVFDYDRIKFHELIFRKSDKGEKIKTLENKVYSLPGNDIVIDNGEGEIVDLPGIIGTANSVVTPDTKRIIFFIDNNDPVHMRRTSMSLGIRTAAVTINEKDVDPELASIAFARGIKLYKELAKGKIASKVFDIYPNPYKGKTIKTALEFVNKRLGVNLTKTEVTNILESLSFKTKWTSDNLEVSVPSYRAQDIYIPEDIVEEVARLYGYHNLPSTLMTGGIPDPLPNAPFAFEEKVKKTLKGYGAIETYTYSMTSLENADLIKKPSWILKLKNPLGEEGEYMRLSLAPSLVQVVKLNPQDKEPLHLFEVANIYPPVRGDLPEEKMMLAGLFTRTDYRQAKGTIESLLEELGIETQWKTENFTGFVPNTAVVIKSGKEILGRFGKLAGGEYYYEFDMHALQQFTQPIKPFKGIPKYPPQVEDLTFDLPERTLIGEVVESIKKIDSQIAEVILIDVYQNSRTFQVHYQNPNKTLSDKEVADIRRRILKRISEKFEGRVK